MTAYIIRRLLLLPLTLFCIIIVNFVIVNLAPGDPVSVTEISQDGMATRKSGRAAVFGNDERYLQFREHYGLTLPILFNTWPWLNQHDTDEGLRILVNRRWSPEDKEEIPFKDYENYRVSMGDKARFIMPYLLKVIEDKQAPADIRIAAARLFVRGGTKQAFLGPDLNAEQKVFNKKIASDNDALFQAVFKEHDSAEVMAEKAQKFGRWYDQNKQLYQYEPTFWQKTRMFWTETRFFQYMKRVLTLDFGTLRDDSNKTVIHEVTRRFKYSLTLAIIPMILTFVFCQFFGFTMAVWQNQWPDHLITLICLILFAIPIFVVVPFLIEKIALNHNFPFTNIPFPFSGFTSPDDQYFAMTSSERIADVLRHILLPLVAIMYGSLAAEARLSRTAVLEVLRQDYIRTAKAKGLAPFNILYKHVGRNAAVTIVTSIAGSLGIILGGSLIVETVFEINGFGKFFYDAVINRDYNVIMFSAFAGSFLTLLGYLVADIAYTLLDPRVTLD